MQNVSYKTGKNLRGSLATSLFLKKLTCLGPDITLKFCLGNRMHYFNYIMRSKHFIEHYINNYYYCISNFSVSLILFLLVFNLISMTRHS